MNIHENRDTSEVREYTELKCPNLIVFSENW